MRVNLLRQGFEGRWGTLTIDPRRVDKRIGLIIDFDEAKGKGTLPDHAN